MDYFNSDEGEMSKSSKSNREMQEKKDETFKSDPCKSVDVKTTKEVLRSNTELQDRNIIISVITDDEENLESLNSDNKVGKEESLKSGISNAPFEKESKMEESVELNVNINEEKDFHSSVSVGNPSNIDVSACHPSVIDCTSSVDPILEESSKSNISDKELLLYVEDLSMSDERASETAAPNLEETGFHIHKKKLLNLHQALKQFHSIRKNTPENLSGKKTPGASRPNKDSQLINKPMAKYSSNIQLSSVSNKSKESETESTSFASLRTPPQNIEDLIQIVSSLLSNLTAFSRNLETLRAAEGIYSTSLKNRNSPSVRLEAPIDPAVEELSNMLTRAQYVLNLIPLIEHLLDDLLGMQIFLDRTGRASCNPCADPDYGPTLDERLFASITKGFGKGVESTVAQNIRSLLSGFIPTRRVAAVTGMKGESRPEATAERGFESFGKFDAEQKTVTESVESEPSVSRDSTSQQESTQLQRTLALDSRLEAETNSFDIKKQLLRLSAAAGYEVCYLIIRTTEVLHCITNYQFFLPHLERFVAEIVDDLEHLFSLQQECSGLLSRCRNREDSEGVICILNVKTRIAAVYNKLLQNISTLTSNFNGSSSRDSD